MSKVGDIAHSHCDNLHTGNYHNKIEYCSISVITNRIHFWTDGLFAQNFRNTMVVYWTCLLTMMGVVNVLPMIKHPNHLYSSIHFDLFTYCLVRQYKSFTSWYWIINVDGKSLLLSCSKAFHGRLQWSPYTHRVPSNSNKT